MAKIVASFINLIGNLFCKHIELIINFAFKKYPNFIHAKVYWAFDDYDNKYKIFMYIYTTLPYADDFEDKIKVLNIKPDFINIETVITERNP